MVSKDLTEVFELHKLKQLNLGFGIIHSQLLLSSTLVRHNKIYPVAGG